MRGPFRVGAGEVGCLKWPVWWIYSEDGNKYGPFHSQADALIFNDAINRYFSTQGECYEHGSESVCAGQDFAKAD